MTKAKKEKTGSPVVIKTYKAFDKDMKCRGYQYEVGKTYTHTGAVSTCRSGFHSCENPFDVLNYYELCDSRFAEVTISGKIDRHGDDTKIASASITIGAEIKLPDFIKAGVKYLIDLCKTSYSAKIGSSGDSAKIGSSGDYAKIGSSGDYAQIGSSGYYAKIGSSGYSAQIGSSGDSAQIGSSGYYAKIGSSGDYAQIGSSGYYAKIGSSGDSAKIGSSGYYAQIGSSGDSAQIGSSGYSAQIGSSGYYAKIGSSGDYAKIGMEGVSGVAISAGVNGKIKAGKNGAMALTRWVESEKRYRITVAYVGENSIKADTWYELDNNGVFVEVTQ